MTAPDAGLVAAYAAARYEVSGEFPSVLLISDSPGIHDEWLAKNQSDSAVVITAWNPFSHQLSPAKNEAANRHLESAIRGRSLGWALASAADPTGRWREASFCVFDVPDSLVDEWLIRYQQNAVIRVRKGGRPTLVWHVRFNAVG